MAYRVWIGSVAVDCDTPEEVIDLAKRAGSDSVPSARSVKTLERLSAEGSRWTEKRANEFFRLIDGKQRKLVDILLEHEDGRTDAQLLQQLSLTGGKQLAGVLTGLVKNAKKVGADPKELYVKKPVSIGGKRGYEYFLSDSFRSVAKNLNL
jgi:hypothetical protein